MSDLLFWLLSTVLFPASIGVILLMEFCHLNILLYYQLGDTLVENVKKTVLNLPQISMIWLMAQSVYKHTTVFLFNFLGLELSLVKDDILQISLKVDNIQTSLIKFLRSQIPGSRNCHQNPQAKGGKASPCHPSAYFSLDIQNPKVTANFLLWHHVLVCPLKILHALKSSLAFYWSSSVYCPESSP